MSKDREAKLEVRIRNERQTGKDDCAWRWPCRARLSRRRRTPGSRCRRDSEWSRLGVAVRAAPARQLPARGRLRREPLRRSASGACAGQVPAQCGDSGLSESAHRAAESGRAVPASRRVRPARAAAGRQRPRVREAARVRPRRQLRRNPLEGHRAARPAHHKVFQIERTQEVYVIIDASRLSARPAPSVAQTSSLCIAGFRTRSLRSAAGLEVGDTAGWKPALRRRHLRPMETVAPVLPLRTATLERYVTAALVLGLAAEQQGDLFGLLTFTDQVEELRARPERQGALQRLPRCALHPAAADRHAGLRRGLHFIRLRLRRRALLVFLTALDDPVLAESFVRNMDLIRRQHLVLVNMLQPPGVSAGVLESRTWRRWTNCISISAGICSGTSCASWRRSCSGAACNFPCSRTNASAPNWSRNI